MSDPFVATCRVGVRVIDVADGRALYSLRADETFIPASNMKLLTTAAALDQLGPQFAFVTTFALAGDDLLVLAGGDPGLGDERLAKRREQPVDAVFVRVAGALKRRNVSRLRDLVVDATVFDREFFHPNWPADQRDRWYAAEVGGFNFNDNCIDIRLAPSKPGQPPAVELTPDTAYVKVSNKALTDSAKHVVWFSRPGLNNVVVAGGRVRQRMWSAESVPIHDPPAFAAQVLADVLAREGVTVTGRIRFSPLRRAGGSPPPDAEVVHRHEQLIGELLWRCNTHSQNFIAESMFKALGAYPNGGAAPTAVGSWASGRQAVAAFLRRRELAGADGAVIDDGSGLSKANRVSPMLLTELLASMSRGRWRELWHDSLASGGVDGTLRKRFKGLDGDDVVQAKTGTLATAAALSGYVRTADDRELAFCILFDHVRPGRTWQAKRLADRIVALLARSGDKGP